MNRTALIVLAFMAFSVSASAQSYRPMKITHTSDGNIGARFAAAMKAAVLGSPEFVLLDRLDRPCIHVHLVSVDDSTSTQGFVSAISVAVTVDGPEIAGDGILFDQFVLVVGAHKIDKQVTAVMNAIRKTIALIGDPATR